MKPAIDGGKPTRDDFLVFGQPEVLEEDILAVSEVMRSCWLGTGSKTAEFERKFSKYVGTEYAVGLSSCTSAIHLALLSLDLNPLDEVLCPIFTFTATASQIIHAGLKPVFIDCQMKTQNIEPTLIESKITPKTKAIIVVHFAGYPCNMEEILDICKRYELYLIEDSAHAIEGTYNGKHCGTFGDAGCFSFYSTKNITTATGEGGMLITNNKNIEKYVRKASLHGMSKDAHKRYGSSGFAHYSIDMCGFKNNLTDVQSAMAISQLARVEKNWIRRDEIWNMYNKAFNELSELLFTPPMIDCNIKHAHHLYTIHLKVEKLKVSRDFVLQALYDEGIGCGVHYLSLHNHPYYIKKFGMVPTDFPNAQWISERTMSLPLSVKLSDQDVKDVINAVQKILEYYRK